MDPKELGRRGESAAVAYLQRVGFTVLETNWRTKAGEIDVVAVDGKSLVLIEVKTRRTLSKGSPEDAVSPAKQRKLGKLAAAYIQHMGCEPAGVRFDVVTIHVLGEDKALLRHHRAAFQLA
jgi:putative endonuclease